MSNEFPLPGAINCRRTQANSLEACLKYYYDGGSTITLSRMGEQQQVQMMRGANGSLSFLGLGRYTPVVTPSMTQLAGR